MERGWAGAGWERQAQFAQNGLLRVEDVFLEFKITFGARNQWLDLATVPAQSSCVKHIENVVQLARLLFNLAAQQYRSLGHPPHITTLH